MEKRCNVVILSTEKASNIWLWEIRDRLEYYSEPSKPVKPGKSSKPQHLYITSDEEIKSGDWCTNGIKVVKATPKIIESQGLANRIEWRKIIGTTDSSLMYSATGYTETRSRTFYQKLPKPSQAFIKKYCEAGGIDEVMVEYTSKDWDSKTKDIMMGYGDNPDNFEKELKPKINTHNEIAIHTVKNSWSRQEVEELCKEAFSHGVRLWEDWEEEDWKQWERFKKENL